MNFLTYLSRRLTPYWQVLLTLALGVILAVTLLASGPVMVESVLDFALHRTLTSSDPLDANLRLVTTIEPSATQFELLNEEALVDITSRFGRYLEQVIPTGETRWTHPWPFGEALKDQRVNFAYYNEDITNLFQHAEFTSGGWPAGNVLAGDTVTAVVGNTMAKEYDLEVGDRLPLSIQPGAAQPEIWIEVVGIIRPKEYQDPFWFGGLSPLQSKADSRYPAQYSVLVPAEAFFEVASSLFPTSEVQIAWNVLLSPKAITIHDLPDIQAQLHAFKADLEGHVLRLETGLPETLESISARTESARVPLYLLITTVVLLALYYVLMAATLSLRQARREFAVLQSRGASPWQLSSIKLIEAVVISGVAVLSGPGLALLMMRGLISFGPLADTSEAHWALQLPQAAWLAAIVGAIACLISVLGPLPGAVRRSIVTYAQSLSRSGQAPLWQRYYLDVVFMLAGLILLWRVRIYGGILSETGAGPQVDWLLLLAPLAMLLGAATIMLRIFPLLLQLGARVVSETRGLPATLAFWQAARDPGHIARLVLLLTLAMALGSLSSGLNIALDRNETDRAYFSAGSDLRLRLDPQDSGSTSQGAISETSLVIQSAAGFKALSGALRTTGSLQITIENAYPTFDVLAVDPQSFKEVARFRHDFARVSIPGMLDRLEETQAEQFISYELPGFPVKIGMWLLVPFDGAIYVDQLSRNASISLDELSLMVKISTARGETITIPLYPENPAVPLTEGWQYFEGQLPTLSELSYPVNLQSFWFRHLEPSSFLISVIPQLAVDGLTVVDGKSGEKTTTGLFESGGPSWSSTESAIALSLDDLYPRFGKVRLLLDFGLSGLDITNWIGVNLSEDLIEFEERIVDRIEPSEELVESDFELLLPGRPSQLGLWVLAPVGGRFEVGPGIFRTVGDLSTVDIQVRLRAQDGELLTLQLQSMGEQEQQEYIQDRWQYFWADVIDFREEQYPLVLEAFRVRVGENTYLPMLVLDLLTIVDGQDGEAIVAEEFEGLGPPYWQLQPSQGIGRTSLQPRGRRGNGLFMFFADYGDLSEMGWIEVIPVSEQDPTSAVEPGPEPSQPESHESLGPTLPVIVSSAFMELTQAEIGDRMGAWMSSKPFVLEVVDVVAYFPTMLEGQDAGYAITSDEGVLNYLNRIDYQAYNINELFVSLEEGSPFDDAVHEIRNLAGNDLEILNAEDYRQTIKADPLALGLRSVTTLGYLLTSVLSLVGFGTYFYMSVRQRRKMYGVLRALGMSSAQIYGSLLLEQIILILSGLALGTGLGVMLNQLTLPGLPLSLGGQPPIPPFLAETDWAGIFRIYLSLAIAFLLSLGLATLSLSRARLHEVLRVDEE
jgi:ABC-type lipoprotein release transport system permease subunit